MFEDIFFAIVYGIMGLVHDRKYETAENFV